MSTRCRQALAARYMWIMPLHLRLLCSFGCLRNHQPLAMPCRGDTCMLQVGSAVCLPQKQPARFLSPTFL